MSSILVKNEGFDFYNRNYYEILGVSKNSSQQEIKEAYRKLAKIYHPDYNDSFDAIQIMQLINEAYDVLSDIKKRKQYDSKLEINNNDAYQTYTKSRDESENDFEKWLKDYLNIRRSLDDLYSQYIDVQKVILNFKLSYMPPSIFDIKRAERLKKEIKANLNKLLCCSFDDPVKMILSLLQELKRNLKNMDLLTNYTNLMIELENNLSAGFLFNELKSAVNNSINNSENSKTVIMYLLQEYLRLTNIISNYEKNHIAVPNSLNYLCEILLILLKEHKVFLIDVLKELDLDLPKL